MNLETTMIKRIDNEFIVFNIMDKADQLRRALSATPGASRFEADVPGYSFPATAANVLALKTIGFAWEEDAARHAVAVLDAAGHVNEPPLLYTAGYRDSYTDVRLPPATFYDSLPANAVTVDIRSHPYSPFAPDYTGGGVARAVERWKLGVKAFYHVRELGNTRRDASGKRISPPTYVDANAGFARLTTILRLHGAALIFCACSYATHDSASHRCHRFFVADEMAVRLPGLRVVHLEAERQDAP